jgi:hypothetical protein
VIQPLALHEFHHVVDPSVRKKSDSMHRKDAGMLELRDDSHLVKHAFLDLRVDDGSVDHFDRNFSLKVLVACNVYAGHTALANLFEQFVRGSGEVRPIGHVAKA